MHAAECASLLPEHICADITQNATCLMQFAAHRLWQKCRASDDKLMSRSLDLVHRQLQEHKGPHLADKRSA